MALSVEDVTDDERGREGFAALPGDVYRDDRFYCAPLASDLDLRGERAFLATRDGQPIARICARVSRFDATTPEPYGRDRPPLRSSAGAVAPIA